MISGLENLTTAHAVTVMAQPTLLTVILASVAMGCLVFSAISWKKGQKARRKKAQDDLK